VSIELSEVKVNEFANLVFSPIDMLGHLPISFMTLLLLLQSH
jgi:hypothetical protein